METENKRIQLGLPSFLGQINQKISELNAESLLRHIEDLQKITPQECLKSAFENTKAFLETTITRRRIKGIWTYRNLLSRDETNLNALAGFTAVCSSSKTEKQNKITQCSVKLNTPDKIETAIGTACLEIGFALVFLNEEFHLEWVSKEVTREQFLNQINPKLSNHLIFQTDESVDQTFPTQSPNVFTTNAATAFLGANYEAVRYLREGLSRNHSLKEDEIKIWQFYLAKAYNRLVGKAYRIGMDQSLQKKWCHKAVELFCDVLRGNQTSVLSTKSYVYIGHIASSRKHLLDESSLPSPSRLQDIDLNTIWENPGLAFKKAHSILPEDGTVLVRYGKFLQDTERKFDEAIEMFSKAIKLSPENWLAYNFRMQAFKTKYQEQLNAAFKAKNYSLLDLSLLEKAKEDGEMCCNINASEKNLRDYARILVSLARCPKEYKGRQPNEVDFDVMREAIDVYNRMDADLGEHDMSTIFKERAICHYYINEMGEALFYMELAVYTYNIEKRFGLPVAFTQLFAYFTQCIEMHEGETDERRSTFGIRRLKGAIKHYIKRYTDMLEGKLSETNDLQEQIMKYQERKIKHLERNDKDFVVEVLASCNPTKLDKCLQELSKQLTKVSEGSKLGCIFRDNREAVAQQMILNILQAVDKWTDRNLVLKTANVTIKLDIGDEFETPGTFIPSYPEENAPIDKTEKRYDFLVLHSDEDKDWVACCLLLQLEHSQKGFKGLIPERDFEPGKSVLQNIEEGINNSDKILLVVSKNTPEKFYQDLERTQVLTCLHLFNEQHKDTFIIDLGVDDLPDPLRPFSDQVINCSRTPMTLNEVREVLAAPQLPIFEQRPRVCIRSTQGAKVEQPEKIMISEVAEPGRIEALQLLRCGFQQTPIYGSVNHLRKAEGILKFGYPPSDIIILYEGFVVCYDTNKKISKWIAYHLTPADLDGPAERDAFKFHEEERLPANFRATLADYGTTDFCRGHRFPAAEAKHSKAAMHDSFNLTNIYPEKKRNIMWNALEVYIREKVLKDFGDVRIFTGPIFRTDESAGVTSYGSIGQNKVAVPTHFFKIVIATTSGWQEEAVCQSFIVKNKEGYGKQEKVDGDEEGFRDLVKEMTRKVNLKTIEDETGIQFHTMLRASISNINENLIERCPFIDVHFFKNYESQQIEKNEREEDESKSEKRKLTHIF